ncbi:MAG: TolC family protein [Chitinophagales bacterium]|nr:TolC family protein [Chitinophagales bacterium]
MKKIIASLVLLLVAHWSQGQVLTLDSVLNRIEKNNPQLKVYEANILADSAYASGAKSWDAPTIQAGIWNTPYGHFFNSDYKNSGQLMFAAEQSIPNPGKLKAKQNFLNAKGSVQSANRSYALNQLLSEAKLNYYNWVILKRKQSVLISIDSLLTFIIKDAELRYPYNQDNLSSVYKAKAELFELNIEQVMNENEIQQKQIALSTLMNRDKNFVFDVDTNIVVRDYQTTLIDTTSINKFRSDIRSIDQSINVQLLNQKAELSNLKPDFGIRCEHMQTFGNQPLFYSILGMVTIPIAPWSKKQYHSNAAGMQYEIEAMQNQKQSIVNETAGKLQSIQTDISNKKIQLEMYHKNIIPALQNNYHTTLLAYEQNKEDFFVVLDAIRAMSDAQLENLNLQQEQLQLQVSYDQEIEQR